VTSHGIIAMTASSSASLSAPPIENCTHDNSHYEQACDQAIAMCDGNLRSTIKALIMANEYLEAELMELQAVISSGCMPNKLADPASNAA
jgi:hypothetical protein